MTIQFFYDGVVIATYSFIGVDTGRTLTGSKDSLRQALYIIGVAASNYKGAYSIFLSEGTK